MKSCVSCGLAPGNSMDVELREFHLRPTRGSAPGTGTVVVGRIALCEECLDRELGQPRRRARSADSPYRSQGADVAVAVGS